MELCNAGGLASDKGSEGLGFLAGVAPEETRVCEGVRGGVWLRNGYEAGL